VGVGFVGHGPGGFAVEEGFLFFVLEGVELPALPAVEGLGEVFIVEGDDVFIVVGDCA
jgi:hypothetical protein